MRRYQRGCVVVINALASGRKARDYVDAVIQERTVRDAEIGQKLVQAPMEEKIFPCNRRR